MENTFAVIQDTWNEDEDIDLLDYISNKKLNAKYLSENEILNTDNSFINVLFCDTDIIQKKIEPIFVPNCYPCEFNSLYNRNIKKIKFKELDAVQKPFFIKPFENDKSFDARKVYDNNYNYLIQDLKELNFLDDDYFYVCDIVEFINEYRLFIGNSKIYGIAESTDILINSKKAVSINPPKEFLDKILELNTFNFCVIDVGIINLNGKHIWSIVEVNPPFALSSYDWDIDSYFNYCKDAFHYLKLGKK